MILWKVLFFYSGKNQKANVLKIDSDGWMAIVLNSKARAHKSLIHERKPDHKVEGVCKTYDTYSILLNTLKNSFECVSM